MIKLTKRTTLTLLIALIALSLGYNVLASETLRGDVAQNGQNVPPAPRPFSIPPANAPKTFTFPQALADRFNMASASVSSQIDYANTSRVTDASESISVRVPRSWNDVESGPWIVDGQEVGLYIAASPDLYAYQVSGTAPGVFFGVSNVLVGKQAVSNPALMVNPAISQLLLREKNVRQSRCQDNGRFDYADNHFQGEFDLYLNCSTGQTGQIVLASMPAHQSYISLLRISLNSQADLAATATILNTFQVLNSSLEDSHHDDDGHQH